MLHEMVEADQLGYLGFKPAPLAELDMRESTTVERRIFARRAEKVWFLHDENNHTLLVAGIVRPSQVGIPELWIVLADEFTRDLKSNMRDCKEKIEELLAEYPWIKVRVDAKSPKGQKFVTMLGFTEFHRDTHGDREYIHYEVRRGASNSSRA